MKRVDLSKYSKNGYNPGSLGRRILWHVTSLLFFRTHIPCPYNLKTSMLRLFGARLGKNVVIKQDVSIKYPWFLAAGDNVWIGENVWIDNLSRVTIGSNVCISQGAYLTTGSHDYNSTNMSLITKGIAIEDGVWIGAKAIVCPGVVCETHSVLTAGSVAAHNLSPYKIYQGNPAVCKRGRIIEG